MKILEKKKLIFGLLIFVVPFVIYAGSFKNQFLAGDDEEIVLRNVYIKSWDYLPNIFTENYKAGSGGRSDFWRPFQLLTYAFIVNTVGLKVWAFHFASVLFHSLCGLFLYFLLVELFKAEERGLLPLAAAASLLWAVHPIHNEELAVTTGLASPTHLFWILAGLLLFIRYEKRQRLEWLALAAVSYFLALFSKESGIVFPGLVLGMHLTGLKAGVFKKSGIKQIIYKHSLFWVTAMFYVIARLTVLNFKNTLIFYGGSNLFTDNMSYRLYTFFTVVAHGLRIIFVPAGLYPERSWVVYTRFFNPLVVISFLAAMALCLYAIIMWKKRPFFTFGVFWFLFSYLPMSNIVAQINALVWDHWFYTPSVGAIFCIAALANKQHRQKTALLIMISVAVIFSAVTIYRNHFFRDTESVSRYILGYEPNTVKTWNNLGMALARKGKTDEAINCYRRSIELADIYPQAHHNLGGIYFHAGKYKLAEREYLKALSIKGDFYYSYIWLGKVYLAMDRREEAVRCLKKALEIYPHLPGIKEFLSRIE